MAGQTQRGKAFVFKVASALSTRLVVSLAEDSPMLEAMKSAKSAPPDFTQAADVAAKQLVKTDKKMKADAVGVRIQPTVAGRAGDVRDIIVVLKCGQKIGVSAKVNNKAVKHSRASRTNDLFENWMGAEASDRYWSATEPVWSELDRGVDERLLFSELDNKEGLYLRFIRAFEDEFHHVARQHPDAGRRLFTSLMGTHDFYKVMLNTMRRVVEIQPMNWNGTLGWTGRRLQVPDKISSIRRKNGSNNTLEVHFDQGWVMTMRIHSARSEVERSLKFDVQLVGLPPTARTNEMSYRDGGNA